MQEILLTIENTHKDMIKQALNGQEALDIINSQENLSIDNKCIFDIIFLN
jgi:hypothetical protein